MTQSPHPVDKHVGRRLREIRRAAKLKQPELATFIGVSPQLIQRYEVGETRISASRMYELAEAMEVTVSDFFYGLPDETAELSSKSAFRERNSAIEMAVMARTETKELMAAFSAISKAETRQKLLEFVRVLAASDPKN